MSDLTERAALPVRLGERFALGELIGRGEGSRVHRAHDTLLDRPAAVKVFPVADDPRARREVRLLAALDHPGLVPVYDVDEVDGHAVVVTALYEGGSLADRLARGPLELGEALLVGASVADALDHVHRAGALHRAVTPTNVLFDDDGRAHLADFGVALVAGTPRVTDSGDVVGRAHYLAPEQVRGDAVGTPADVYALGLVLVESLTGRRAFPGEPSAAARERLERGPEVPGTLPVDVGALVAAMTAADPASRPRAGEVTVGLRRAALAAESVPAAVVPTPRRPMLGRGVIVAGGVAMSAVLAGTVVFASTRPVHEISATLPPTAASAAPAPAAPRMPISGGSSDSDSSDPGSSEGTGTSDSGASESSDSGSSGSGSSDSGSSGSGSSGSGSSGSGTPVLAQAPAAYSTSGRMDQRESTSLARGSSQTPSTSSPAPSSPTPPSSSSRSSSSTSQDTSDDGAGTGDSGAKTGTGSGTESGRDRGLVGDLLGDGTDDGASREGASRDSGHRKHQGDHQRHGHDQSDSDDQGLLDGLL